MCKMCVTEGIDLKSARNLSLHYHFFHRSQSADYLARHEVNKELI